MPSSKVLKAFNTTFAGTLGAKTVGPNKTTVLIAGDDADAKSGLAAAISAGGVDAIDAGSLSRARELEAVGPSQPARRSAGPVVSASSGNPITPIATEE